MVNYTIIIPHRNSPKLLERCLSSIPERDDLEIIVIDDNSDTTVVDFNKFPGYDRSDVKVILTKDGKGTGYCRNIGMDDARGTWFIFADASGFFEADAFNTFDLFNNSANEIVFFGATTIDNDSMRACESCRAEDDLYIAHRDFRAMRYQSHVSWAKMIRADMLRRYNIRFDITNEGNDVMFSLRSGYHANKIDIYKKSVYTASVGNEIPDDKRSPKILLTNLRVAARRNDYVRKHNIPAEQTYMLRYVYKCMIHGKLSFLYMHAILSYLWHQPNEQIIKDYRKLKELNKRKRL